MSKLLAVDIDLRQTLCEEHRKYFYDYHNGPIALPTDFKFPFSLHFSDGSL